MLLKRNRRAAAHHKRSKRHEWGRRHEAFDACSLSTRVECFALALRISGPSASVFSDGVSCPSFLLLGSFPCGGWQASPVNFSAVPFSMTRAFEVAPTKSYPMNLSLDVGDIL